MTFKIDDSRPPPRWTGESIVEAVRALQRDTTLTVAGITAQSLRSTGWKVAQETGKKFTVWGAEDGAKIRRII